MVLPSAGPMSESSGNFYLIHFIMVRFVMTEMIHYK